MASNSQNFLKNASQLSASNYAHTKDAARDEMQQAYNLGSEIAREQLSAEDKKIIDQIKDDSIIVVPGTYDHIHRVLESLKLPFKVVSQSDLLKYPLRPDDQTVYVNCASSFPVECARRLRKFVDDGGQLITTDWALKNVLEVAFSEFVIHNGRTTQDEVVGIQVNDPTNPLVSNFLLASQNAEPQWWLESSSYPIKIVDHQRVQVLIKSNEMKQRHDSQEILVTFDCGKGNVIHMVSHFYLQRSETRDARHKLSSEQFATEMKTSDSVREKARNMTNINYGQVQSSTTSAGFIYNQISKRMNKNSSNN